MTSLGVKLRRENLLLSVEGIHDRNLAEELVGAKIYGDDFPIDLPTDEYQVKDLVGLEVFDIRHQVLGTVTQVLNLPSDDILEVGPVLIPFRKEFVKKVDLQNRRIEVELLPGMIEEAPE